MLCFRLIVSASTADFFVGLFVMPFGMLLEYRWLDRSKLVCQAWVFLDLTLSQASLFNMLAINIDRFYSVFFPLR